MRRNKRPKPITVRVTLEEQHFPFVEATCTFKEGLHHVCFLGFDGNSLDLSKRHLKRRQYPEWAAHILTYVLAQVTDPNLPYDLLHG